MGAGVVVVGTRKIGPVAQQTRKFVGLVEQRPQRVGLADERHAGHVLPAQGREATGLQLGTQGREAYFLFEVLGEEQGTLFR